MFNLQSFTIQMLWLNLSVQFFGMLACALTFHVARRRLSPAPVPNGVHLAEDSRPVWHSDTLTEIKTRLDMALETIQEQKRKIESLESALDSRYVTKQEFDPVRLVVYGMIGLICATALASILVMIWKTK